MEIKDIKTSKIKILIGISLILFSLICLINVGYISQTFVVIFTFLFGYYGYFILLPGVLALGIYIIIKKDNKIVFKLNLLTIAIIILIFACLIFSTVWIHFNNSDPLFITTFNSVYIKNFSDAGANHIKANNYIHINVLDYKLGGGYLGYFFTGAINSIGRTPITTIISSSTLIVISAILFFVYFKKIKGKNGKSYNDENEKTIITLDFEDIDSNTHENNNVIPQIEIAETDLIFNNENDNKSKEELLEPNENEVINDSNNELETTQVDLNDTTLKEDLIVEEKPEEIIEVKEEKILPPFIKPSIDLLNDIEVIDSIEKNKEAIEEYQKMINLTFNQLSIDAEAISYTMGPRVTRFDIKIGEHSSVVQVPKIMPDISQRLGGISARFESIVAGKMTSGLEIPNKVSTPISFKEIFKALPENSNKKLLIPFGKNISGEVKYASLTTFPHLLVAGSTGSGKSVFVHSVIVSFLMSNTPDELKLLLIDPKRVEFTKYKNIPYLLCPPVTDPIKAHVALQKLVEEMNRRYTLFENTPFNKIDTYNKYAKENNLEVIPYIVGIVDEFADLINTNKKVELEINLLAAKSRACGIHLIIATQRPSVDVITGTIKNNLPVRVALRVSDQESSKTILGKAGAEGLLGYGDMLLLCPDVQLSGFARVQGCLIDDEEIIRVVDYIKKQREPIYNPKFMNLDTLNDVDSNGNIIVNDEEETLRKIKLDLLNREYVSISLLSRVFEISYNKGGKIIAKLQAEGIVSYENEGTKGFKVFKENIKDIAQAGSDELTSIRKN